MKNKALTRDERLALGVNWKIDTPEYNTWKNMRKRCYAPYASGYELYGGKGIRVCDQWRESFDSFLADMGPRPTANHSIERHDSSKDYGPDNCSWETSEVQNNNTSRNIFLTYENQTLTVTQWAKKLHINPRTLANRISRGWTIDRALAKQEYHGQN